MRVHKCGTPPHRNPSCKRSSKVNSRRRDLSAPTRSSTIPWLKRSSLERRDGGPGLTYRFRDSVMNTQDIFSKIRQFLSVPRDNPELLKAQYRAFSRQLPLMYFILLTNTWALAASHYSVAPHWLTIWCPA